MVTDKQKMGKKSRKDGKAFEAAVRKDLEKQGWIVSKWSNQVKFMNEMDTVKEGMKVVHEKYNGVIVPAKGQFNPFFHRIVGEGSGFPDFVCFMKLPENTLACYYYEVIGVESKMTGKLDKEEKEKCAFYLSNKTFSKILIASKCAEGVKYEEFK